MENLFNVILAFCVFIYALMFRYGYFSGKQSGPSRVLGLDRLTGQSSNRKLCDKADRACFWITLTMAILTAANGIASFMLPRIPNISILFLFGAFPGAMVFWIVFVLFSKA